MDSYRYRAVVSELERVADEVRERLKNPIAVAIDGEVEVGEVPLEPKRLLLRRSDEIRECVLRERTHLCGSLVHRQASGFDARGIEQIVQQAQHPVSRPFDPLRRLSIYRLAQQQVGGHANRRQWILEVMGDYGGHQLALARFVERGLVEAGVVEGEGRSARQLLGESEIPRVVAAGRMRRQERQRSQQTPSGQDGQHHARTYVELAHRLQMLLALGHRLEE